MVAFHFGPWHQLMARYGDGSQSPRPFWASPSHCGQLFIAASCSQTPTIRTLQTLVDTALESMELWEKIAAGEAI
jgi:hypothetical protein